MAELEERTFDGEKEDGSHGKNAKCNGDDRTDGSQRDPVIGAELAHEMDNELLHQIGAVGNARDKGRAGDFDTAKR